MDTISFLEKLRNKPDHHKRYITFGSTLFLSLIVFFVLSALTPSVQTDTFLAEGEIEPKKADGPVRTVIDLTSGALAEIADQVSSLSNLAGTVFSSNKADDFFTDSESQGSDFR